MPRILSKRCFYLLGAASVGLSYHGAIAQTATITLDPVILTAKEEKQKITGKDLVVKDAGDLDTALRNQTGTYTRSTVDNPGLTVNIRGLQGLGRVNSMIDGVPQNTRNLSGHAGSFDTLLYIDPGLLSHVDVTKGAVSGSHGMGTLGGAADFRTLQFSDVLRDGRNQGGLLRFGTGTNGKDWSGTLAGATRHSTANGGSFGLLGAISGFKSRPYKDGHDKRSTTTQGQSPESWLVKAEYDDPAFGKLTFTGMRYQNHFSAPVSSGYVWDVKQKNASVRYQRDGLEANLWWTRNEIFFPINASGTGGLYRGRKGVSTGKGFDLANRSDTSWGSLYYGVAYSHDSFDGNARAGANGDGSLTKSGVFIEAETIIGAAHLKGGLRYDHWKTEGATDYRANGSVVGMDSRSGGKVNATLRGDYQINETTAVHAELSTTMRPPTASEMFYPGAVFAHSDVTSTQINNNPNLRPETAVNAEIGLTHENGPLSVQAALFNNRIKDYIGYSLDKTDGRMRWVNLDGTSTMKGLELKARYDTGNFFTDLRLTSARTEKPKTTFPEMISTTGTLPDDYATLDIGARWMDQSLTTGARIRHTGKAETFAGRPVPIEIASHTLLDLYADWQVNDALQLYANIENATDHYYQNPNAAFTETTGNIGGRGRTVKIGGAFKF